jgi:hypothetical protein
MSPALIHAEMIHRAWGTLGLGFAFLAVAAAQFFAGKVLVKGPNWETRKESPRTFWFFVALEAGGGLFFVVIASVRLIHA